VVNNGQGERRSRSLLSRIGSFLGALRRKAHEDAIGVHAAALAFATVLGFVPLLAAFLWVGRAVFDEYRQRILAVLAQLLPYSEDALLARITELLDHAEKIRGVGLLSFIVVALGAFASIEGTLNRIWKVRRSRSLRARFWSFLMLLIWGPVLIGAVYSAMIYLTAQPALAGFFQRWWGLQALPFVVTLAGFTMLYWIVPHTAVRFRAALTGGVVAAILLEVLRWGFHIYLELVPGVSLVYGALALALFFMMSIEIAWYVVLLGGEIAYGTQHWGWMSDSRDTAGRDTAWLGLAALTQMALRQRRGRSPNGFARHEEVADDLEVPAEDLHSIVAPLLAAKWIEPVGTGPAGYRLKTDLAQLDVLDVLERYEMSDEDFATSLPDATAGRFSNLRSVLRLGRRALLQGKVADLLEAADDAHGAIVASAATTPAGAAPAISCATPVPPLGEARPANRPDPADPANDSAGTLEPTPALQRKDSA
jgi:membrane protein